MEAGGPLGAVPHLLNDHDKVSQCTNAHIPSHSVRPAVIAS